MWGEDEASVEADELAGELWRGCGEPWRGCGELWRGRCELLLLLTLMLQAAAGVTSWTCMAQEARKETQPPPEQLA